MPASTPVAARPWALVTGASSGIGRELAIELAGRGYDLLLVARTKDLLTQLADELHSAHGAQSIVMLQDLADPSAPSSIHDEAIQRGLVVEVLVNNAGFGAHGRFVETSLAEELSMLQVNIGALTQLTKLFLRDMVARGSGRILNVASTGAFQPGPMMTVYYATKAYVLSFTEALAAEVRGSGPSLCALCPGPVPTRFQDRAGMQDARIMKSFALVDAKTVARVGCDGLFAGKSVVIPGLLNRLVAFSIRFAPRWLVPRVVMFIMQRG